MAQIEKMIMMTVLSETDMEVSTEALSEVSTEAISERAAEESSGTGVPWIWGIVVIAVAAAVFLIGRKKTGNTVKFSNDGRWSFMEKQSIESIHHLERKKNTDGKREILLKQKRMLWEMEQCEPYRKLFLDLIPTLQELIGLEARMASIAKETMNRCIKKRILPMITQKIENAGGKIVNHEVILPVSEKFDIEETRRKLWNSSDDEMERLIRQYGRQISGQENELSDGNKKLFLFCVRDMIKRMGSVTELLELAAKGEEVDREKIKRAVQKLKIIMEENGIFVMFAEDGRLNDYPSLRQSFIAVEAQDIPYPGLFVKRDGKMEIFGAYIGSFISGHNRGKAANGK